MVLTPSTMRLKLGTEAPDFSLPDVVSGKTISLASFSGKKGLLVMFICQHCPYVQHIKEELAKLGRDYAPAGGVTSQEGLVVPLPPAAASGAASSSGSHSGKDAGLVAISSNDAKNYPDDAPNKLKAFAQQEGFQFPFLYDEDQEVAKVYTAACTPDFFLFDQKRKLVYRGQLDDSRPESGKPVTGKDLRAALDAVLADTPVPRDQKPSIGCNIKWKPGNEPDYAK